MSAEPESRALRFFGGAVKRPVATLVAFVTLLVIGVIAGRNIPLEMLPSGLQGTALDIWIVHPGASASENESKVVRPIEEQIRTLTGIASVRSGSNDDDAWIEVTYDSDVDMDLAKAELRDRIERVRPQLPDSVERILVWSMSQDDLPLMWFAILRKESSDRSDYLVDTVVQRRLEAVDGVTRVEIYGMLDDSVRILLDEEKVKAARLDIGELIRRLATDNFAQPLGEVYDGGQRVILRSDMRFRSLEEIEDYPLGGGFRIRDVASVEKVQSVRDRLSRINGSFSYFGSISKENSANVVEASRRVKTALEDIENDPALGGQLSFLVLFAQGDFIEASLDQLRSTALWGGFFAALILLLFLQRVRTTICVALSIPVSAMLSMAYVYFTGGSFNILTMTGITLGIGMLVDNSVVVIENIARLQRAGVAPREAASRGVRDVALAVSCATMTTVVVFLPLIFMSDEPLIRIMFGAIGLPLCSSLLFSLLVALVFLPVVAGRIVGPRGRVGSGLARVVAPVGALPLRLLGLLFSLLEFLFRVLVRVLWHAQRLLLAVLVPLRWPAAALLLALAGLQLARLYSSRQAAGLGTEGLLSPRSPGVREYGLDVIGGLSGLVLIAALAGVGLLVFGVKRWRVPSAGPPVQGPLRVRRPGSLIGLMVASNRLLLQFTLGHRLLAGLLAGLCLLSVAIPLERTEVAAFGEDENRGRLSFYVDLEDNFTLAEASSELERYEVILKEHKEEFGFADYSSRFRSRGGNLSMYWDEQQSEEHIAFVRRRLKELLPDVPGHVVRFWGDEAIDTRNSSIVTFQLRGPDPDVLNELGEEAMRRLAEVEGLSELTSPLENAPEQVRVAFDPILAWQMGVTAEAALENISWALRGYSLPRYHEPGREIPFIIEYDSEKVAGLDTLRNLDVYTGEGITSLASFAKLEFAPGRRSIRRNDGQISFVIQGRVEDPRLQARVSAAGHEALKKMELPRGFSIAEEELLGARTEDELAEVKAAALLSLVLVVLLMCILLESFLIPFAVTFTVPFAYVGAMWTLYLTGTTMDSVGWIGIMILIGVVVNNGIVLIDRVHRLRKEGLSRADAVLEGSANRVRPILMTALTTVCGLLPMATSEPPAEGIDYRALATCVAGGLAISTFFTLWIVPLAYTLMDDLGRQLVRALRAAAGVLRPRPKPEREYLESL